MTEHRPSRFARYAMAPVRAGEPPGEFRDVGQMAGPEAALAEEARPVAPFDRPPEIGRGVLDDVTADLDAVRHRLGQATDVAVHFFVGVHGEDRLKIVERALTQAQSRSLKRLHVIRAP
jgi:hypothetical protein